jgi:hypothetical protein
LSPKDSDRLKQEILNFRSKAVSSELQDFIYFGDGEFKGLKFWVNFGEEKEDSWIYQMESVGQSAFIGIEAGRTVRDAIFFRQNMNQLNSTNQHVELMFDPALRHIEDDFQKRLYELRMSFDLKIYSNIKLGINASLRETQVKLLGLMTKDSQDISAYKSFNIFKDFIKKSKAIIKPANGKVHEVDRSIKEICTLHKSLRQVHKHQNVYIKEMIKLYNKFIGFDFNSELTTIIENLETFTPKKVATGLKSIIDCLTAGCDKKSTTLNDQAFEIGNLNLVFDIKSKEDDSDDGDDEDDQYYKNQEPDESLIATLHQRLKKNIQVYLTQNVARDFAQLESLISKVTIEQDSDDTMKILGRKLSAIEKQVNSVSSKIENAHRYYRNVINMVKLKLDEIFRSIDKGVMNYEDYLNYMLDTLMNYKKTFKKPGLVELIWSEELLLQIESVEKSWSQVFSDLKALKESFQVKESEIISSRKGSGTGNSLSVFSAIANIKGFNYQETEEPGVSHEDARKEVLFTTKAMVEEFLQNWE